MKRYFKQLIGIIPVAILLSGCLNNLDTEVPQKENTKPDEVTVQTTANQLSSEHYRAVITDGSYELGASASADHQLSSASNTKAFEDGLLRISKEIFPTDQYYMQEGQLINSNAMTSWLARESEDNPEGLNPALSKKESESRQDISSQESVDPASNPEGQESENENESSENEQVQVSESTPIYLAQILEKNIMVETDQGFALGGIVIGLAMNSTYEYTDNEGVVYHQDISMGEMRERGKQYANMIVGRLRNTEQLRSVPIVVGIYRLAPENENVGGTYVLDGISREGNSVTDWTDHNEHRVALPATSDDAHQQYAYFDNFSDHVSNFFPNLNGISGEAFYIDNGLASLRIEIVTQFYQKSEITALSQYVTDMAQQYLPEGVEIEIDIVSATGTEAYVGRQAGSSQFESHVFY